MIERTLTSLLPWQERAVEKLLGIRVGALYMEQGTGKTRTAVEIIHRRKERIDRVLWLCPCSIIDSIKADISKHCEWDQERLWVYGIESLSSSLRLYDKLLKFVSSGTCMMVVDESNLVKNDLAIRTRNIIRLGSKCRYRLILNGTPITRSMADLYAQWYLLDWRILGYRSFYRFAANHLEFDPNRPGRIVRAHNVDYITEKIAPYCYQVTREECLDLPDKVYEIVPVFLSDEQDRHYDEISEQMLFQLDELEPETIYRMFAALQAVIAGQYVHDDGKHFTTSPMFADPMENPRIRGLMYLLSTRIEDEKCIIFCKYTFEIDTICGILGEKAVSFTGDVPQKRRKEIIDSFAGVKQYFVANKTCAGYGLNLQFCRNVVYYSNDWNLGTRLQSEDRVHRIGQDQIVNIYDIVAERTLDVRILDCLRRKESLMDALRREIDAHKDDKDKLMQWIKGVRDVGKGLH